MQGKAIPCTGSRRGCVLVVMRLSLFLRFVANMMRPIRDLQRRRDRSRERPTLGLIRRKNVRLWQVPGGGTEALLAETSVKRA